MGPVIGAGLAGLGCARALATPRCRVTALPRDLALAGRSEPRHAEATVGFPNCPLPGLVDPTNPLAVTSFARNPRIARVCADLRFGQELGEGIRRMFEEMRLAGLADPLYQQTSGSVRLTLSSEAVDRELEAGSRRGRATSCVHP